MRVYEWARPEQRVARKDSIRLCRDDEIVAFTNTSIRRTVTVIWPSLTDLLGFLLLNHQSLKRSWGARRFRTEMLKS